MGGIEMAKRMVEIVNAGPIKSPFPYCCRYKERGAMYCHDGHDCICECHGVHAPHTRRSGESSQ